MRFIAHCLFILCSGENRKKGEKRKANTVLTHQQSDAAGGSFRTEKQKNQCIFIILYKNNQETVYKTQLK